ncbi:hypothetical protein [Nocardia sp. NRRL S-836]|uniref:hypothetical protein n=1 Tax=Nocardia sp. NRRL S-836 TaxID=1519492 RepID=UPI000AD6CE40|nr:hypothetical protein [Nocardia sp. NRRL S-836]
MPWTNEVSGRVDGHLVQAGVVLGDVRVDAARPVRSAYSAQVRALAPDHISGRDGELAVLAEFCSSEATAEDYLWWRAEAWSGKSALLSWFVLHPPAGVRVVSFFVTSRLPGQNDRRGFVDNVLDQLHDLAQLPPRTDLTDATREPYLLHLLADVTNQIRARGEHLVLVVDGLDEDRGLDGSADAHSIAALLPRHGVRVVVAGRPTPALPADVSADHPLCTTARVVPLSPSPEARAVRDVMIRDLKRLLHGNEVQQDLLGFVTAAGGGLSTADLAELTGASPWQIEEDLRTTAGRSFARRPGNPPVHLLAHDQLHAEVVRMLDHRLGSYRERLDRWAITYRARGWPPSTPRHLLQGHAAVLAAVGARDRLLDHVTDPRRHQTAYTVFGHHDASLGEIEIAQAVFLDDDEPDLTALARLAVHRTSLQASGNSIPDSLPELWVICGRVEHAQMLINLINAPVTRARALMGTAEELHHAGHPERAAQMLDAAGAITSAFNQTLGSWLHLELAKAATRTGDYNRTWRVIDELRHAVSKAHVCAAAALTALSSAQRWQAEQLYHAAEEALAVKPAPTKPSGWRINRADAIVFATMATVAAALGHQQRAAELAATAIDPEVAFELRSRRNVADVVKMLTQGGFCNLARAIANTCASVEDREDALLNIVQMMAEIDDLDGVEAFARTAAQTKHRSARLAAVALSAGRRGEPARAHRLRVEVEATLDRLPKDGFRRYAVMASAVAAADAGHGDRAENAAFTHLLPTGDFTGALSVATALLRRDERDQAERLLEAIEQAARSTSSDADERALLRWIDVMADFRDFDRAEAEVRPLQDAEIRSAAWERLAETIATTGDARRFEAALAQVTRPSQQRRPRMEMIRMLLAGGEEGEAVRLARAAEVISQRAAALDFIAEANRDRALLDEVIALAAKSTNLDEQATILRSALRTAADLGDRTTADLLLDRLRTVQDQMSAEARRAGDHARTVYLPRRLNTLTELAERLARGYDPDLWDAEAPMVRFGAPPLFAGSSGLPFRARLAKAFTIGSWLDVVDRAVDEDPDVYAAITDELDRLHGGGR